MRGTVPAHPAGDARGRGVRGSPRIPTPFTAAATRVASNCARGDLILQRHNSYEDPDRKAVKGCRTPATRGPERRSAKAQALPPRRPAPRVKRSLAIEVRERQSARHGLGDSVSGGLRGARIGSLGATSECVNLQECESVRLQGDQRALQSNDTGREIRDPDAASAKAAERGFVMRTTGGPITPLMVADDARGFGKTTEALLPRQSWFKLRLDRHLHLAHRPLWIFPPEAFRWSRPGKGSSRRRG